MNLVVNWHIMKRIIAKRRVHFLIVVFLLIGPAACFYSEKCPEAIPYFSIQGLSIYNRVVTGQGYDRSRLVEVNESINWKNYFMQTEFDVTYHSKLKALGNTNLYALSCNENGYSGSKIGIDTLYFITLQDYNGRYLKNDTLNSVVLINYETTNANDFDSFFSLSKYIDENKSGILRNGLDIKLTEPPSESAKEYQFKLIYILKNGEKFEGTSNTITLTK